MITTSEPKNKLYVVGGPTATGKTEIGIELSQLVNGEIINADSVQIYKYLNIGSNKGNLKKISEETILGNNYPTVDVESTGVIGHMFDVVDPDEEFSVSDYQKLTRILIETIWEKGKIPILVGGTGLYIDSIIKNYKINGESKDLELRERLNKLTLIQLQNEFIELNGYEFKRLNNSDKNNPRRLIRLIEKNIIPLENVTKADAQDELDFDFEFFYLNFDRKVLMESINLRVDEMFEEGFVEEVQGLLEKGYDLNLKSMNSSGYKEIAMYLEGKISSLDECKDLVKNSHRKYAKRQITWFEGTSRGYDLIKVTKDNLRDKINCQQIRKT